MKKLFLLLIPAGLFSCSSTNRVFLHVQQPAPVTLPFEVKNIGIINRSLVSEKNKALDIVDKVLSLEGDSLDAMASRVEISGLSNELMRQNRFNSITIINDVDLRAGVPGQFPAPLDWEIIDQLCRAKQVDVLFSLELFDTDSKISYAAVPVTMKTPLGNIPGIEHHANMLTTVKSGWRIYDPVQKLVLDEYPLSSNITLTGKGINPVAAAGALLNRKEAVKNVSAKAGQDYAYRIVPYFIKVTREYYIKGNDSLSTAKRKAQTGNWRGAMQIWINQANSSNNTIAGRACYNIALSCEISGQLDQAIVWAQKSYENYNNKLALKYLNILRQRKESIALLAYQQEK